MIDPKDFSKEATPVWDWINAYLKRVEKLPVKSQVSPGDVYRKIPDTAPENAESLKECLEDLDRIVVPGITHWQHPNYHAYFPANSSVESVLAECITASIGAQCMIWDTSPAAAELEQRMMEWLRDAMGLPGDWEGVIQDSASSATLVALICAREVVTGFKSNLEGIPSGLRVYASSETHSSIEKAVGICGIGRNNLVKIPVDQGMRMRTDVLAECIQEDLEAGKKPCAVVATIGTTGTLAVDPLEEIAALCKHHGIWLHVDAAYAGTALLLEEYRWMGKGMEEADSFVFNPHKWMFTNFDCTAYYVRNAETLIRSFEVLPEYLKTSTRGAVNDYRDWGIPLGRRFRALKLWFVIRGFGLDGIRDRLRKHIGLNEYFCSELKKMPGFELVLEPFLNFACFRFDPRSESTVEEKNRLSRSLLEELNRRGKVFLTHTVVNGRHTLRVHFGQTYIEREHVDLLLEELKSLAHGL